MARYVVDANVVISLVATRATDAPVLHEFWSSLSAEDELFGPRMLFPECTSVIRSMVFDRHISDVAAQRWLRVLLQLPLKTCDDVQQFSRALELARLSGHRRAYDMQYLAAAQLENCELVTMDSGLRQAAVETKHPVRYLR